MCFGILGVSLLRIQPQHRILKMVFSSLMEKVNVKARRWLLSLAY